MFNALRSVRTPYSPLFSSPFPCTTVGKTSAVRFRQAASVTNRPQNTDEMDQQPQDPNAKKGDVMSDSYGEGYATRSDEEGFGGIYAGNQSLPKADEEKIVHEYDKSQGSDVKEKEKARHQT